MIILLVIIILCALIVISLLGWIIWYFLNYLRKSLKLKYLIKYYNELDFQKYESSLNRIYYISLENNNYENLFWDLDELLDEMINAKSDIKALIISFDSIKNGKSLKEIKNKINEINEKGKKINEIIIKFDNLSSDVITSIDNLWQEFDTYGMKQSFLIKLYHSKEDNELKNFKNLIDIMIQTIVDLRQKFRDEIKKASYIDAANTIYVFKENIINLAYVLKYAYSFEIYLEETLPSNIQILNSHLEKNASEGIYLRHLSTSDSLSKVEDLLFNAKKLLKNLEILKVKELIKQTIETIDLIYFSINKEIKARNAYRQYFYDVQQLDISIRNIYKNAIDESTKLNKKNASFEKNKTQILDLVVPITEEIKIDLNDVDELFDDCHAENSAESRKIYLLKNILLKFKGVEEKINQIYKINFTNSDLVETNEKYFQNLEKIYINNLYTIRINNLILDSEDESLINEIEYFKNIFVDTLNDPIKRQNYDNIVERINNLYALIDSFSKNINLKLIKTFLIDSIIKYSAATRSSFSKLNNVILKIESLRMSGEYDEALDLYTSFLNNNYESRIN